MKEHEWAIIDHGTRIGKRWVCSRCGVSGGGAWQDLGSPRRPAPYVSASESYYSTEQLDDCELMSVRALMRE